MARSRSWTIAALAFSPLLTASAIHAQGLGDVARAEAARRAASNGRSQKLTEKDLKPAPVTGVTQVTAAPTAPQALEPEAPGAAPGTAGAEAAEAGAATEAIKPREKRDEKYWRERFTEVRQAVARASEDAAAVEGRVTAIDDEMSQASVPVARKSELQHERKGALEDLRRFRRDAADLSAELTALEERARSLKIPAEWIR